MPSAKLGETGPQQGEAAIFDWKWTHSAPGLIIWLVLIGAIALPKSNRDRRVLLILAPLATVNLFWLAFKKVSGMPSATAAQFDAVFHSMAVGIAVLWLVENYFDRFAGSVRFLMFFGTLMAVACLGILILLH